MSPLDDPKNISAIELVGGKWKVVGTDLNYSIGFLSREDYNLREQQVAYLLTLPPEIAINLLIDLPIADVLNVCRSHTLLNRYICENRRFWELKYIRDYGEPLVQVDRFSVDWKKLYREGNLFLYYESLFQPGDINARVVASGNFYIMVIDINNNLWTYGFDKFGGLGLGDVNNVNELTGVGIKAEYVACGDNHTMTIDRENNLWVFGHNDFGQLGLGDTNNRSVPTPVGIKAKFIACGSKFTIIIDMENNLLVCGNVAGLRRRVSLSPAGRGIPINMTTFQSVGIHAKFVACSSRYAMIIDMNDNVLAFGSNDWGQLGLGYSSFRPIITPIQVPDVKAKYISCGNNHTMMIDMEDNLLAFGNNKYGQLGLENTDKILIPTLVGMKAKAVSCGYGYTIVIDMQDNLISFGSKASFPMGRGRQSIDIPIKARAVACRNAFIAIIA